MPSRAVEEILDAALREDRKTLLEPEAKAICRAYEMPTPEFGVAMSASEATLLAQRATFPVVLKIVSPDILHKTEAGGVLLDLKTGAEVEAGYRQVIDNARAYNSKARVQGVLVQHMVPKGIEVIAGGLRDSQFGAVVLFGLGGIFVEVLRDVAFRAAPLTELDAGAMIREIRSYPVLRGIRGQPPADEKALIRILRATAQIMIENSSIDQMDLNPIMAYENGASVVDARMILAETNATRS